MKRLIIILTIVCFTCKNEQTPNNQISRNKAPSGQMSNDEMFNDQALKVYNYDGLKPLINKTDEAVHVVNFWATWCAPCVKELPYFEKLNAEYAKKNVEVLLVSLDFPRQYDTKLKPFLKKKKIKSRVVCFDDTDQNRWIPAIDTSWSGALPATIIYKGNKRKFFEKSFTYKELQNEVEQFLN